MIKDALQYIVGLNKPEIVEIGGRNYSDKNLTQLNNELRAESISMSTLTSLIDYIQSDTDLFKGKLLVHVVAPDQVELISELDSDRKRETLVQVKANLPRINLNSFVDQESFVIMMQSQFQSNEDRAIVLQVAGNVVDQSIANYGDDGVSQKATISAGIANKENIIVPNPVTLLPFRTFHEVEQVPINFVFRMKARDGIHCALYEADGGAWKQEAVNRVAFYLKVNLQEFDNITVIA